MPRVQIEGLGTVEFPEGTSPEEMERLSNNALMEKNTGHPATGAPEGSSTPDPITGNHELANRTSLWEGLKGMGKGAVATAQDLGDLVFPKGSFMDTGHVMNTDAANGDQRAGKVAEAGLELLAPAGEAEKMLPSAKRAGAVLGSIRDAAEHVPVSMKSVQAPLQRLAELGSRGSNLPKVADQLLNRTQMVGDINFPEARDFYSSVARPSFWERMTTSPEAKATLGKLKSGLNTDLTEAAETIGRGREYTNALKEYRNAMRLRALGAGAASAAGGAAIKGAGLAGAAHVLGKITSGGQ